jgi:HCOMODA/2-hydroxy-3-carboxy-muconic semialdehyde decarboxylase
MSAPPTVERPDASDPSDPGSQLDHLDRQLRIAGRTLSRHGLAHAYGHCSVLLSADELLVCASLPMGLLAPTDAGQRVPLLGDLPAGVLGEVRIHQQIYRSRPDVGAVVRCMPPALMALGTARRVPQPRHGAGTYFGAGVALWDDPQLVRDDVRAKGVARALDNCHAVVMRGNGVVVAAPTLLQAVVLTWYLEDAARLELSVRGAGLHNESAVLSQEECAERATTAGGIFERMGLYLSAGDPEGTLT